MLCANLARLEGGDAEEDLAHKCDAFTEKFEALEKNGQLGNASAEELYLKD